MEVWIFHMFRLIGFILQVLQDAETMLLRMEHRGACGCDNDSGDGAGVMTGIPHKLYTKILK